MYKHSPETLNIVTTNNKNNAIKLKFISEKEELLFDSWVKAEEYFGITSSAIKTSYKRKKSWKEYNIFKLSTQTKKIKVDN